MSKVNKLGQYKNIEIQVKRQMATKEEVEQQVQAFVKQNPTFKEKETEVALGDVTTIDFEGFKDGVAFDGGKAQGHQLEIGSGQFIPGFEDQMIGMKKGEERELSLTFPSDYGVADLAGADVIFKVKLHKIETKEESTLNDEFVAGLNIPDVKTVEDLHQQMENYIQSQYDQKYQQEVENKIFDQLMSECEVEVEESDIERALNLQIQHMSNQLASQGMALEQYLQMMGMNEEKLREQLTPSAKQQASFEGVIDEIVVVENIETTDEEVDQQIEMIATQNQMSKEDVLKRVNAEDLKHDYNRVKASQLVLQTAIIKE